MSEELNINWITAFNDNYIWVINHQKKQDSSCPQKISVIDPGDAAVVEKYCQATGKQIRQILITHHHHDHTGGVRQLTKPGIDVIGPGTNSPFKDSRPLQDGETITIPDTNIEFQIITIPGHTLDHIAFYGCGCLFCGDTLFSAGCGRLFEGDAATMYASLMRLKALPAETLVYCAHEYTINNLKFAQYLEPKNEDLQRRIIGVQAKLAANKNSLPSTIALERKTNPFLRCDDVNLARRVAELCGEQCNDELATFTHMRALKDNF